MNLYLYNSLSRSAEEFQPVTEGRATLYACGPTVYGTPHIGNFRTYTLADIVYRALVKNGYKTALVENITDVGHLVSDADEGEDKMAKGAAREGLNMWEVAAKYTLEFIEHSDLLNLTPPDVLARATGHIHEQIELITVLEEKGFTYLTSDGVYFDTSKVENYGELSDLDEIQEGARVEKNEEKRNPSDFALWKFHQGSGKREMEWESPWGVGFPGWHIECSAMSLKYLGGAFEGDTFTLSNTKTIDVHIGGQDLKMTHHPNEIVQSECATDVKFVNYWLHGAFMTVDGEKISKSLGNSVTVQEVLERGFDPIALRYFYFSAHYRKLINFTWEALDAAQNALFKLYAFLAKDTVPGASSKEWEERFMAAVNDDLNMPEALAVLWEMLKSDLPDEEKVGTLFSMDEVLGLRLRDTWTMYRNIPAEIKALVKEREELRAQKDFAKADALRDQLKEKGYTVNDTPDGSLLQFLQKS